jgi:hypothetical protein
MKATDTIVGLSSLGKVTTKPRRIGLVGTTPTVHVDVKFEGPIAKALLAVGQSEGRMPQAVIPDLVTEALANRGLTPN